MIGIYKLGYDIDEENIPQHIFLCHTEKVRKLSGRIMLLSNKFKIKNNYLDVDYIIVNNYILYHYLMNSHSYYINNGKYDMLFNMYIRTYNIKNDEIIFTTSLYEFENIDRILKLKEIYPDMNNNIIENDI